MNGTPTAIPAAKHPEYYERRTRKNKKDTPDKLLNPDEYTEDAVLKRVAKLKEKVTKENDYSVDAVLKRINSRRENDKQS